MTSSLRLVPALALVLSLAACGSNTGDRALTGAGVGAAAGATIGAISPLSILPATLIGAGVGAAVGGLTSADEIDLGKPIWE
jgi:osmotically inducible lipoprotein OsmB